MCTSKRDHLKQDHYQRKRKIVVVMPAYNAEKTLEKTYRKIPKDIVDDVILVDDGLSILHALLIFLLDSAGIYRARIFTQQRK